MSKVAQLSPERNFNKKKKKAKTDHYHHPLKEKEKIVSWCLTRKERNTNRKKGEKMEKAGTKTPGAKIERRSTCLGLYHWPLERNSETYLQLDVMTAEISL